METINIALVALVAVLLIINHMRQSDCREQVRSEVNEARRIEINRSHALLQHAFAIWSEAAKEGREVRKESEKGTDDDTEN